LKAHVERLERNIVEKTEELVHVKLKYEEIRAEAGETKKEYDILE
jgi:hypothetical protein